MRESVGKTFQWVLRMTERGGGLGLRRRRGRGSIAVGDKQLVRGGGYNRDSNGTIIRVDSHRVDRRWYHLNNFYLLQNPKKSKMHAFKNAIVEITDFAPEDVVCSISTSSPLMNLSL